MPQIRHDFDMYYTGTYIGVRDTNDSSKINPFYVERIDYDTEVHDGDISDPECVNGLIFCGSEVLNTNGETRHREVTGLYNEDLVTELPNLGYIKLANGNFKWVTYRPNRTVKKGITGRRLEGISMLNHRTAYALYHTEGNGRISSDYIKKEFNGTQYLMYKGLVVGEFTTVTDIVIEPEIEHQINRIREENPECQVTVRH